MNPQPPRSLQLRLSLWLSLVILGVALVAGAYAFAQAFHDAIEAQDDQLDQIARVVARERSAPAIAAAVRGDEDDDDARIAIQVLPPKGSGLPVPPGGLRQLAADVPDGLQTVRVGDHDWRVVVTALRAGERLAVGQRTEVRDELASAGAWHTVTPLLLLIPTLALLVALLVRGTLKPLRARAAEIDARDDHDLTPVASEQLPREILPFVVAINRLLARVARDMQKQQRFIADAAHELRSPVAALTLQAESIASATTPDDAAQRLATLRSGLQRTRQLLEQLLSMARSQAPAQAAPPCASVHRTVRLVLEDLMPLAEAKAIDLGVQGSIDAVLEVSEVDLSTLVNNLVGNAIRYTPVGGRVDVSLHGSPGEPTLWVEDTGPGIAEAERERVFDAFYRGLGSGEVGSGLGLAIVGTIARRIGARIRLGPSGIEGAAPGLRISVTFKPQVAVTKVT